MPRRTVLICATLALGWTAPAVAQDGKEAVRVEIVATASEYVPRSTSVSRPGHVYTNCLGSTSYFGRFSSYGDSGTFSGTADTNTHCSTTFTPPSESTLTTYRRVNNQASPPGREHCRLMTPTVENSETRGGGSKKS